MSEQARRRRKRQKKKPIWPILLIAAVILAAIAAILLIPKFLGETRVTAPVVTATPGATATPQPTAMPTATPRLEIDPNAGARITPTPAPQEPGVAIPGWGSMTIPAGVTQAATAMKNPEANEGWYYLTFELRLKDTGEVIFTTGLIPPGQYCNQVTLTRAMEPGEYAAVVHVQPYRMSNLTPTNNADLETVLFVK